MKSIITGIVGWVSFVSSLVGFVIVLALLGSPYISKNEFASALLIWLWILMTFIATNSIDKKDNL